MAVHTLKAPVSALQLPTGTQIRLEAIDPATGDPVTGVTVSNVAVYGSQIDDDTLELTGGPFMFVPGPE